MDLGTAKLVVDTFEDVIRRAFALLDELPERCSPEEFALLKRETARVANIIDLHVYPLVLKEHPQLDPLRGKG